MLEMMISVSVLAVVGTLGMVATLTSSKLANVMDVKETMQAEVRATMLDITQEVQLAFKADAQNPVTGGLPCSKIAVYKTGDILPTGALVGDLRFQIPEGTLWSTPIIYRYVYEDTNANGKLDSGEDANNNQLLDRRIVRIKDNKTHYLGAANTIVPNALGTNNKPVTPFSLNAAGDTLTVTLATAKSLDTGNKTPLKAATTGQTYIMN